MDITWKYIDEYELLPDTDFIHCDTRDFHILCVNNKKHRDEINLKFQELVTLNIFPNCLFTKDKILKVLKDLETRSGGKGKWRRIITEDGYWLKYIRFIKCNDDKYLAYSDLSDVHRILSNTTLESLPIDKEILNFILS